MASTCRWGLGVTNKCVKCGKPGNFNFTSGKHRDWLCEEHWFVEFNKRFQEQSDKYKKEAKK